MLRIVGLLLFAVVVGAAGCGTSAASDTPTAADVPLVPRPVVGAAAHIADAARAGDVNAVAALAAEGFEFDFERPDIELAEHLAADSGGTLLEHLEAVLAGDPGRRLSPLGNGTVQELWVYPAMALTLASEWSESETEWALESGLFSSDELAEYREADAYLGFSVGLTPEGDWLFFTSGRVGRTPR